jgi:hypothetical protein
LPGFPVPTLLLTHHARDPRKRASALLVQSDPVFNDRRDKLVALTARYAIPAIYDRRINHTRGWCKRATRSSARIAAAPTAWRR